jgi:hypothetical protein
MHTKLNNSAVLVGDDGAPAHADDSAADAMKEAALRKKKQEVRWFVCLRSACPQVSSRSALRCAAAAFPLALERRTVLPAAGPR